MNINMSLSFILLKLKLGADKKIGIKLISDKINVSASVDVVTMKFSFF